jgi:sugar phosphate permease
MFLSDHWRNRKKVMFISASVYLLVFLILIYRQDITPTAMYGFMFAAGFFFSGQNLVFAMATERMPVEVSGTAAAFTNMIVMLSGVIFEPLVGWLLDHHWSGELTNGIPHFTLADFTYALTAIPIALFFAIISLFFIRETYPKIK